MSVGTSDWTGSKLAGGRYEITGLLGEGGMGYVYRARDNNLGTEVVIKAPRAGDLGGADFSTRFSEEVRSLVRLAHLHIVRIIDVGVHRGLPFAVMPFLTGGSLEDRRTLDGRIQPLPVESISDWLPQIASALDFIHSQSYVHRDIKPANILFDAQGHAYLSDFGVVKALTSLADGSDRHYMTVCGAVMGTPVYMAPELISGDDINGTVDQYALAVTVYSILTGRPPVEGSTAAGILLKRMGGPVPSPDEFRPGLPRALCRAILKGLETDRNQRFPDCSSFANGVLEGIRPTSATARRKVESSTGGWYTASVTPALILAKARSASRSWRATIVDSSQESIRFRVGSDRTSTLPILKHFFGGQSATLDINVKPGSENTISRVRVEVLAKGPAAGATQTPADRARDLLARVIEDLNLAPETPTVAAVSASSSQSSRSTPGVTGTTGSRPAGETTVILTIPRDAGEPEEIVCTVSKASARGLSVLSPRAIDSQDVLVRVHIDSIPQPARAVYSLNKGDQLHQVSLVLSSELLELPASLNATSAHMSRPFLNNGFGTSAAS